MEKAGKGVAWLCIFSALLTGCYSSVLVQPNGVKKEELSRTKIEYLVTKDGTEYEFVESPKIDERLGMIVGPIAGTQKVSLTMAAAARIEKSESGTIELVTDITGKKYDFVQPPNIVDGTITGMVKCPASDRSCWRTVSIPLADVLRLHKTSVYAGSIEYVVTKDGKKYVFEEPASVANDTIVGSYAQSTWHAPWDLEQVSIPLSDVAEISVSEYDPQLTLWACVGAVVGVAAVTAIVILIEINNMVVFGSKVRP